MPSDIEVKGRIKVGVKEITLTRAEGLISECGKVYRVSTFALASHVLASMARTAPECGGYNKIDFEITFDDDQSYSGRADIDRSHVGGYDLAGHVRQFLRYLASSGNPAASDAQIFLDTHEIE